MADGWAQVLAEGPDDLRSILLDSVRADLRAARDALDRHDAARVAFLAHRLKISARLTGDGRVAASCALLEAAAQAGYIEHVRLLLMQVERAFGIALRARNESAT